MYEVLDLARVAFLAVQLSIIVFLLANAVYQIYLIMAYRRTRGPDEPPKYRFSEDELPSVAIQLPVYNEGEIFERCLRSAAAVEYPDERLTIQVLDDSDDGVTSDLIDRVIGELRCERPGLVVECIRRTGREGFKAGILRVGVEKATSELFAIFDADFVAPPDFLARSIHYFADPDVAVVQGRWSFLNRNDSLLTRIQAARTDAHQMFEQTARHRTGRMAVFHGTAGVWRASALAAAGGWECSTEVEDVELSIRTFSLGGRVVYLDHLRVPSELPVSMRAYLAQQMRWKRGWTRIARVYSGTILRARAPLADRLDLLQRLHQTWASALALAMTLCLLPTFLVAGRFGLEWLVAALLISMLGLSLVVRALENRTLVEDPAHQTDDLLPAALRWVPFNYVLSMGLAWALTQATFEAFGREQVWDVTPKGDSPVATLGSRVALAVRGSAVVAGLSGLLAAFAAGRYNLLMTFFYGTLLLGSMWVVGALLLEARRARRIAS